MIISRDSRQKVYHEEYCPYTKRIRRRKHIDAKDAENLGYRKCSCCGGIHGEYLHMKVSPDILGRAEKAISFSWDGKYHALCLRTKIGFWKIMESEYDGSYILYHLNHGQFSPDKPDKILSNRRFHRQQDVKKTTNMYAIVNYVYNHDKAQRIIQNDYRNLPKSSKKKRKYYNQAKNREKKKQIRRVNEIFNQLAKGEL